MIELSLRISSDGTEDRILRRKSFERKKKNVARQTCRRSLARWRMLQTLRMQPRAQEDERLHRLIPDEYSLLVGVLQLMKFSLASAPPVCHCHSSGLMERPHGLLHGRLVRDSEGLLVARHVILAHDVRIARRRATLAIRIRVDGARFPVRRVKCRTGS